MELLIRKKIILSFILSYLKEMLIKVFNNDFSETHYPKNEKKEQPRLSQEDKQFIKRMDENVKFIDGHYELPLPLKNPDIHVPNNLPQAIKRLDYLKRKMLKNEKFKNDYAAFMKNIIEKGYAKRVKNAANKPGKTWYIPHHGVYHPKKPEKIRVVFDCSAVYNGVSLNTQLLQGPINQSIKNNLFRYYKGLIK